MCLRFARILFFALFCAVARAGTDFYALVGARPGADAKALRQAFRKTSLRWHPDRFSGKPAAQLAEAERMTKAISVAYKVLSHPETRENYDLGHILERDWAKIGPSLEGKIHIYTGDMDNYYLNNAVYEVEEFLESTTAPYYGGDIDYGDRAEHCWNGDHDNSNAISRLRYNTMYLPRILELIEAQAPEGADLTSWRH